MNYRKRDKSEIDRKEELGLNRVDNYSSLDISEAVMHSVRDYMYTPYLFSLEGDRNESVGIIRFKESGHTMFSISLYKINGDRKEIIDTVSGSIVYEKPSIVNEGIKCPVCFDLLGNLYNSDALLSSKLTVSCCEESGNIVTYLGINLIDALPCSNLGVNYFGTNLHDYTLGSVDYVDGYVPSGSIINNATWSFLVSDWISAKRYNTSIPVYNTTTNEYVTIHEGADIDSSSNDVATINGVPFCGAYGVTVNGKDARHITITAKHSGSSREEAGVHDWDVLRTFPRVTYYRRKLADDPNNRILFNGGTSATTKEVESGSSAGLCTLTTYDRSATELDSFINDLGYYIYENGSLRKSSQLSDSTVISLGAYKKGHTLLMEYVNTQFQLLRSKFNELISRISSLESGSIEFLPEDAATENNKKVELTSRPDNISFDLSNIQYISLEGSVIGGETVEHTRLLRYSWDHQSDCPISVFLEKAGAPPVQLNGDATYLDNYQYDLDGSEDGVKVKVVLTNLVNTESFENYPLTFYTKYVGEDSTVETEERPCTVSLYYNNTTTVRYGSLISNNINDVNIDLSNTVLASINKNFYEENSNASYQIDLTSFDYENLPNGKYTLYLRPVRLISKVEDDETVTSLSEYTLESSLALNLASTLGTGTSIDIGQLGGIYHIEIDPKDPMVNGYSQVFMLMKNAIPFARFSLNVSGKNGDMKLSQDRLYFGSTGGTKTIDVTSNFSVSRVINKYSSWLEYRNNNSTYEITASNYTGSAARVGELIFINAAGKEAVLTVTQDPENKFITVIVPYDNGSSETKELEPGGEWEYIDRSSQESVYKFKIRSNTGYRVAMKKTTESSYTEKFKNSDGTGGENIEIPITIPKNSTQNTITYVIRIEPYGASSSFTPFYIGYNKCGTTVSEIVPNIEATEFIFYKEYAFDPIRSRKIIKVSCTDPSSLQVTGGTAIDTKVVVRKYVTSENSAEIHIYPSRVTPSITSSYSTNLTVTYKTYTKQIPVVFEPTNTTVGSYFNVSSTLFICNSQISTATTFKVTSFSFNNDITLSTFIGSSSSITIGPKTRINGDNTYGYYNSWDITVNDPPVIEAPYVLKMTCGGKSKYISIYSSGAIEDGGTNSIQLTAFGHLTIPSGCSITPILYEKRLMYSKIGTNNKPLANNERIAFYHTIIHHDLSNMNISEGSSAWTFDRSAYLLEYDIDGNQTNYRDTIKVSYTNSDNLTSFCYFSNNNDVDFDAIPEKIAGETSNTELPVIRTTYTSIPPLFLKLDKEVKYLEEMHTPNFFPCPPDWKITTDYPNSISESGYLTLSKSSSANQNTTVKYSVNSEVNGRAGSTNSGAGNQVINLVLSDSGLINTEPENSETSVSGIIYDLSENGLSNSYFSGSGISFNSGNGNTFFNSSSSNKLFVLGSKISAGLSLRGKSIIVKSTFGFNISNRMRGFNETSTAMGHYNRAGVETVSAFDTDWTGVVSSSSALGVPQLSISEQIWSDWKLKTYKPLRKVAFYDGGPYHNFMRMEVPVAGSATPINVFAFVGICGVASVNSNTNADITFVPFVNIVSAGKGDDYILVKGDSAFGFGMNYTDNTSCLCTDITFEEKRTIVENKVYKSSVKISGGGAINYPQNSGVNSGGRVQNVLFSGDTKLVSGNLDFELTHEDFIAIIKNHISKRYGVEINADDNNLNFIASDDICFDGTQRFSISEYSWLRNIVVTIE